MTSARRSVVLHFDLNRTILMSDAAGGRTMENTVNYLLSECTWGHVDAGNASQWVCVSTASSIEPPATPTTTTTTMPPLITYKQFVDDSLPYKSLKDASLDEIEPIKAFNKAAKKQRTALQSAFTGHGGPGARVIASFQQVMDKLHFPEGAPRDAARRLAAALPKSRLQEAWSEGRYYLLPSFISFLTYLADVNRGDRYDVTLVFRTFGDDIPDVAKELELLVEGTHPLSIASKPLPASFKLEARSGDQIGTFYRDGFESHGSALAVGTLTKVPFTHAHQSDANALQAFYDHHQPDQNVEIVRGFQAIQTRIHAMAQQHGTIALRDYWEWWSAHAEAGEYGKLLLVDATVDATARRAVFFDDHIEAHHAHIVDVRDVATARPVPFEESMQQQFLQRVEPFAAITDEQYFIKLVQGILHE